MLRLLLALSTCIILINKANAHDAKFHDDPEIFKIYTTATFAPFNYIENGKLKGFAIELVDEIMQDAKFKHTSTKALPWARAYNSTKNTPNSMVFAMYRTPLRENEFTWIGPIVKSSLVLLSKKNHQFDETNFSIASVRESASMQTARELNIGNNLESVNDNKLCIRLLNLERVDTCATGIISAYREIDELKLNKDNFTIYKNLKQTDLYLGINKETPAEIINFFNEKLDELEKNGFLKSLKQKYNLPI